MEPLVENNEPFEQAPELVALEEDVPATSNLSEQEQGIDRATPDMCPKSAFGAGDQTPIVLATPTTEYKVSGFGGAQMAKGFGTAVGGFGGGGGGGDYRGSRGGGGGGGGYRGNFAGGDRGGRPGFDGSNRGNFGGDRGGRGNFSGDRGGRGGGFRGGNQSGGGYGGDRQQYGNRNNYGGSNGF